jgi:hypothetical protein
MEAALYGVGLVAFAMAIWLAILATLAVRHDVTLERFQKLAQWLVIWTFPLIGAAFVLHLVWEQYPEAIPQSWIPWLFKRMIFGRLPPSNRNRDDNDWPGVEGTQNSETYTGVSLGAGDCGGGSD